MTEWDEIAESIRLDEVLTALGIRVVDVTKHGSEHWAHCPLPTHPGRDTSGSNFSINEEKLVFNCFPCQEGGPLPKLVALMEGFENDPEWWDKGVEWLIPYSDGEPTTDSEFMEQLERYLERADERPQRTRKVTLPFYSPRALDSLEVASVDLFEKWHIKEQETIDRFGIRFDPERIRIGKKGEFTGPALVIPHYFEGNLVGFQERWPDERPKWLPKYTNSTNFPKRETLYNWDRAVEAARAGRPVFVVESGMTAVRLDEIGYTAVATFGAGFRPEQIRLLSSLPWLILSGDNDPDYLNKKGELVEGAGVKSRREGADILSDFTEVEVLPLISKAKADLADLEDDEVDDLVERREPVFDLIRRIKRRR